MTTQTMTLYFPGAALLNANQRLHWAAKAKLTARLRGDAGTAAMALTPVTCRQHVMVWFGFTTNRRRDVGNLYPTVKALLDGVTDARVWPDDNDDWIEGPDLRPGTHTDRPGLVRIHITLEDT